MKQIDLDDLPPKAARLLETLEPGEELVLVRNGGVEARLTVSQAAPRADPLADLPPEEAMSEVMEQFRSIIEDEF